MSPDSRTSQKYLQIDILVKANERWLDKVIKSTFGYSKPAICRRISQAVTIHLVGPFLRASIEGYLKGKTNPDEAQKEFKCGEMKIDGATGEITPTLRLKCSCIAKFMAWWLLIFLGFLRSVCNLKSGLGPATLVYGVPDANLRAGGTTQRFENFCNKGPLDVLSNARMNIVQVNSPIKGVRLSKKFRYSRYPLLKLFSSNRLSFAESLAFIFEHVRVFFGFLYLVIRQPIVCLLWQDFASHAAVTVINNKKLIKASIISNSNWTQQFLWMSDLPNRNYKTYMALYSLNSSAKQVKEAPHASNHPSIRHLRVDLIWIWDEFYEKILRLEGVLSKTQVVGPILWYLPEQNTLNLKSESLRISLFDISPMNKEYLLTLGMQDTYYSTQTMMDYLNDVLAAVDEVRQKQGYVIEITLKHKRKPSTAHHDFSYFDFVKNICENDPRIRLARDDANLYTLISVSDLVIVTPFSSPGYVAKFLDIPSLFYDPTDKILVSNEIVSPIRFASNRENLTLEITNILARKADSVKCQSTP
jgi:hypothetical protein